MPLVPVTIYVHLQFSIITLNNFVVTVAGTLLPTDVYGMRAPALQASTNQTTLENPFLIAYTNSVLDIEAQALNIAAALQTQTPKPPLSPINNLVLDATMHATNFDTRGFFLQPVHSHSAWSCNTRQGLRINPLESYDRRCYLEQLKFDDELRQTKMMKAGLFDAGDRRNYHAYDGKSSPIGADGLDFDSVADPYGLLDGEAALGLLDTLRHSLGIFERVHTTGELLLRGTRGNSITDNVTYNACPEYSGADETMGHLGLETYSGEDVYAMEPGMKEIIKLFTNLATSQSADYVFFSGEVLLLCFMSYANFMFLPFL